MSGGAIVVLRYGEKSRFSEKFLSAQFFMVLMAVYILLFILAGLTEFAEEAETR